MQARYLAKSVAQSCSKLSHMHKSVWPLFLVFLKDFRQVMFDAHLKAKDQSILLYLRISYLALQ